MHPSQFRSKPASLGDHFSYAQLAGLNPFTQCAHSFDDFAMRKFGYFLPNRDQQRYCDTVSGDRDFFASRDAFEKFRKTRPRFKSARALP